MTARQIFEEFDHGCSQHIPTYFPDDRTTFIHCNHGDIGVERGASGWYIKAKGYRRTWASDEDLRGMLTDAVGELGGLKRRRDFDFDAGDYVR